MLCIYVTFTGMMILRELLFSGGRWASRGSIRKISLGSYTTLTPPNENPGFAPDSGFVQENTHHTVDPDDKYHVEQEVESGQGSQGNVLYDAALAGVVQLNGRGQSVPDAH